MAFDYLSFRQTLCRHYRQHFAALREETGLSQSEIELLLFLAAEPVADTASAFSGARQMAKSRVSAVVDSLEGRGYLQRVRDPQNRRLVHLCLTPQGRALASPLGDCKTAFWRSALTGISAEERRELYAILQKIQRNAERDPLPPQ